MMKRAKTKISLLIRNWNRWFVKNVNWAKFWDFWKFRSDIYNEFVQWLNYDYNVINGLVKKWLTK